MMRCSHVQFENQLQFNLNETTPLCLESICLKQKKTSAVIILKSKNSKRKKGLED